MRNALFYIVFLLFLSSCQSSYIEINGDFTLFGEGKLIILESLTDNTLDSTLTKDGKFSFRIKPSQDSPTIYNLKHKSEIIPIIAKKGDKLKIKSVGSIAQNYKVEGSQDSQLIKEISTLMTTGAADLDSIYKEYLSATELENKKLAVKKYREHYFKIKREQLAFIMKNKGSIAAVYALFQRLPDDNVLFNGTNDAIYYSAVADSISVTYPDSPYITTLNQEIQKLETAQTKTIEAEIRTFPEISMDDIYGRTQSLNSLKGKVILLSFWQSSSPECRAENEKFRELHKKYSFNGFEIFQVSLDTDRHVWVSGVLNQKLPWTNVSDLYGKNSSAAQSYNVKTSPTNFLIDRAGNIVARDLRDEQLENLIKQSL